MWLTAAELAAYLGVSVSWVRQRAAAAGIRKYHIGGRAVRYDRAQVDALLKSHSLVIEEKGQRHE